MLNQNKVGKMNLWAYLSPYYSWLRLGFLLLSVLILVAVGILRGGDTANVDMSYLYSAGVSWLRGLNPYKLNEFVSIIKPYTGDRAVEELIFAYPPWSAPLCMLIGIFPFAQATWVMKLLSLVSLAAISFICIELVITSQNRTSRKIGPNIWYLIPALLALATPTSTTFWLGQTSLIISAVMLGSFYFAQRNQWVLSGILLAIAAMKPQLSIFVILWFILERRWKVIGVMAVSLVGFSLVPMFVNGGIRVFSDWLSVIQTYKSTNLNTEQGGLYIFTLRNLLFFLGINVPSLIPLGVLLTVAIWINRVRFFHEDIFSILTIISILFGASHIYDLVILAPVISSFYDHAARSKRRGVMLLACMAIVCAPSRFSGDAYFLMIRIALLVLILGYLTILSCHKPKNRINYDC